MQHEHSRHDVSDAGHPRWTLLGEDCTSHFGVLHIASYVFLGFGCYVLSSAWTVLYQAQSRKALAAAGAYARIRHPHSVAFALILLGFLLQWPTLLTLLMFPILLVMYWRLAITEELQMRQQFGSRYGAYAGHTARFAPLLAGTNPSPELKVETQDFHSLEGELDMQIDGVSHVDLSRRGAWRADLHQQRHSPRNRHENQRH
jgi:hypothetical protein